MVANLKLAKKYNKIDAELKKKRKKALSRNVKRRKEKYATARDQELMFGY